MYFFYIWSVSNQIKNLGKGSGLEIFNQRIKQKNVKQGDIHHGKNK